MCKELSTEVVLGCSLKNRRSVTSAQLRKKCRSLEHVGMLANISYPAVRGVALRYPEIVVKPSVGSYVVVCNNRKGILFDDKHLEIAYAWNLRTSEFAKVRKVLSSR